MTADPSANGGEAAPNDTSTAARRTASCRSAVTARPDARLDGNSAVGRRVRDLFRALMTRLGEPTDVIVLANALAWAELKAAAEVARARLLEGDTKSSTEVVRVENLCRRAAASVGLEPGAAVKTDGGSWEDLLLEDEEQPDAAGDAAEGSVP